LFIDALDLLDQSFIDFLLEALVLRLAGHRLKFVGRFTKHLLQFMLLAHRKISFIAGGLRFLKARLGVASDAMRGSSSGWMPVGKLGNCRV
jgi:hypothetical protein